MMKSSQASVELRGMIIANDESGAVDHAMFLQAFNEFFLSSKKAGHSLEAHSILKQMFK
ncbi:hypothetical protein GCM10020331_057540 [Ectobacillus funiculus]